MVFIYVIMRYATWFDLSQLIILCLCRTYKLQVLHYKGAGASDFHNSMLRQGHLLLNLFTFFLEFIPVVSMLLGCRIRVGCSCIDDIKGWLLTCVRSCFVDSKVHVFMYLFCLFRYISAERCTWICSDLQLRHWCMYGRSNISFIQKSSEFVQCDAFYMSKSGFVKLF